MAQVTEHQRQRQDQNLGILTSQIFSAQVTFWGGNRVEGQGRGKKQKGLQAPGTVRQEVCRAQLPADKRPTMPFQKDTLSRCNFSHHRHYFLSRADQAGLRDKAPRHVHTEAAKT